MISTGVSIMEFVKDHKSVNTREICEFIEFNADTIITQTLKNMNREESASGENEAGKEVLEEPDADDELLEDADDDDAESDEDE